MEVHATRKSGQSTSNSDELLKNVSAICFDVNDLIITMLLSFPCPFIPKPDRLLPAFLRLITGYAGRLSTA